MFSMDSSFWQYKVNADIHRVLKFSVNFVRSTYAFVHIYAIQVKDGLTRTLSALCHLRIML